jgi:soluble lytic murein transglycosylase-like protein
VTPLALFPIIALVACTEVKTPPAAPVAVPAPKVATLVVTEPSKALKYRAALTREATFVFGPSAPVPLLAGQIQQESSWDCSVTARDGGMGCAQFMEATAGWLAKAYPELGGVRPYDPVWAFQAQARLNKSNYAIVKGVDECNRWAATLLAYNAGAGIVQGIQKLSPQPGVYWNVTENEKYKQSDANFKSSRDYPRRIIYKHQPAYATWGRTLCL